MVKIVFEFGAQSVQGVAHGIEIAIGSGRYTISTTSAIEKTSLEYSDRQVTLREAIKDMEEGKITSFLLFPEAGPVSFAIICVPFFVGDPQPLWFGAIDHEGIEWKELVNRLLEVEELRFVTVSVEEGLDLEDKDLTINTFPWDHWRLIFGALRTSTSTSDSWEVRKGPAYVQVAE